MFHNHNAAFKTFTPAPVVADVSATVSAQTIVETPHGWRSVDTLRAGDSVATLDGGFAEITAITAPTNVEPMIRIPGGVLNSCSDVALPASTHLALTPTSRYSEAPVVSAPLKALSGWRGIRPTLFNAPDLATVHFENEEMIYAQTGLLIHAHDDKCDSFFQRLGYGDARALLALDQGHIGAPDQAAA